MGLWIIVSPWMLRISHVENVLASCVIGGVVLVVVSVWGAVADNWNIWSLIISAICGIDFVVQPFLGHWSHGAYWGIAFPGLITLFLNFWTWFASSSLASRNGPRAGT